MKQTNYLIVCISEYTPHNQWRWVSDHGTPDVWNFLLFVKIRVAEVWEELQVAVDELPKARSEAWAIQWAGGAADREAPCCTGKQVKKIIRV